eukprot:2881442-Amphidinium_carterae.1
MESRATLRTPNTEHKFAGHLHGYLGGLILHCGATQMGSIHANPGAVRDCIESRRQKESFKNRRSRSPVTEPD